MTILYNEAPQTFPENYFTQCNSIRVNRISIRFENRNVAVDRGDALNLIKCAGGSVFAQRTILRFSGIDRP